MNNFYVSLSIGFAASAFTCLLLIPAIIHFSNRFSLVDKPNERSVHTVAVPRLGGIGIFFSTVAGITLSRTGLEALGNWPILFSSACLLFLTGIWDDLKSISARLRFVIQICCATALAATGLRLTSLYGIFGIYEISVVWQYVITVLIITGTTNAFNLIDGIDGLAGGLAFISICVLLVIAFMLQQYPLVIVLASLLGALSGFLKNNFNPAKIFMGDGGSLVLGYMMASIGILLIEKAHLHAALLSPSKVAILVTAILVIPVFDTIRVFTQRIWKGKSPFSADKTHIHHLFLVAGLNHRKTTYILYAFAMLLVLLASVLPYATGMSITIIVMVLVFHITTEILRINQGMEKWIALLKKIEREGIA